MSTIDFSHLRLLAIFASVVECGSFAAAARKLNSSRSRISEQVAQLEQDLGVRLLQRSTRQLTITSEGQQVYEQARQLPDILNGIEAITTPQLPSGRVAITMNHDIAHKYVLPVLPEFQRLYPQVQLDLMLDDSRRDLIAEQIDLAIRIGLPKDDSLIARVMHEEKFILCASPEYLTNAGIPKSLNELQQHQWIMMKQPRQTDIQYLRQNNKPVAIKPQQYFSCNSPLMMQQMAVRGLGVCAILPSTVKQEMDSGQLIQVMPSITSEPLLFALVYPSRRQVPQRTRAVIDYLLQANIFSAQ